MQELCEENLDKAFESCIKKEVIEKLSVDKELAEDAFDIIYGICETMTDETSCAFSYLEHVLFVRIYDGERYVFPLPFMLTEDADAEKACLRLAAYSRRELLPLIITDVPREELEFLCSMFPHIDAFAYEDDDDSFYVKVNNECDMLNEVPSIELDGITLDELRESDKEKYAALCRNRELNKYWGYDVDADNPDGKADFYLDVARREFNDGIALALAVREGGEFVGEATIYDFDYLGSASIAVRVLPECHGRGIGSRATKALIELARGIGLGELHAEILVENENSIKMTSKYMEIVNRTESKVMFTLLL